MYNTHARNSWTIEVERRRGKKTLRGSRRLLIFVLLHQFAGVQAINTAILDKRPDLRKHEGYVILVICVVCWLLAIPMVFDGGIYLFTLMDWNTASWAILLIGIAEVGQASWCYGCNKFLGNAAEMGMRFGRFLHGYWWFSWVILAPLTCLVSLPLRPASKPRHPLCRRFKPFTLPARGARLAATLRGIRQSNFSIKRIKYFGSPEMLDEISTVCVLRVVATSFLFFIQLSLISTQICIS